MNKNKRWLSKRKIIIASIVLVCLGVILFILWPRVQTLIDSKQPASTTTSTSTRTSEDNTTSDTVTPKDAPSSKADTALATGNKALAAKTYNDAINASSDNESKGILELQKSNSFAEVGDLATALQAALAAEKDLQSSSFLINAVSSIGGLYERLKDTPNAVVYYQKTIKLLDVNNTQGYNKQYYVDKVASLGGS